MKTFFFLVLAALATTAALAQSDAAESSEPSMTAFERWRADPATTFDATEIDLGDFLWSARPVVVFADTPANPAFTQQMDLLESRLDNLVARDVVIVTDTDPGALSDIRRRLRPRGFMLTLIGKDGRVELRKPFPWDVREISRSIDKMPLRQQEIRDRRGGDS